MSFNVNKILIDTFENFINKNSPNSKKLAYEFTKEAILKEEKDLVKKAFNLGKIHGADCASKLKQVYLMNKGKLL